MRNHESNTENTENQSLQDSRNSGSWMAPFLAAAGGLLLIAGLAVSQRGEIVLFANRIFGPPPVKVQEVYDSTSTATFDHKIFGSLLSKYVDPEGWVDYARLSKEVDKLDAYIALVGSAPFEELGRDEKLAFLINAYNAFTLKLILDYYPLDSIKDIGKSKSWDSVRWNVSGNVWSLNQIEHEQIRPKFKEPRIHFALVCAAVGCPPLRNEAFTGEKLERQLAGQAEFTHAHKTWFNFISTDDTVGLTKLYQWYGGDFEQASGSVLDYASQYSPALKQSLDSGKIPTIEWLPYDWSLNSRENKSAR